MPFRDGTGPQGQGPLSGRGFGPCFARRGFDYADARNTGWGRGYGRRRGFCLGYHQYEPLHSFASPWNPKTRENASSLKDYKEALQKELAWVKDELEED